MISGSAVTVRALGLPGARLLVAACALLTIGLGGCAEEDDAALSKDGGAVLPGALDATVSGAGLDGSATPALDSGSGGNPAQDGAVASADSAWCKARAVFQEYCTDCHDGKGSSGTPMGLVSYQDLTADSAKFPGTKIFTRAGIRMHATEKPMPPQGVISAAEQKLVDDWLAAGAPAGSDPSCGATANDAGVTVVEEWPADCEEKYKFLANDNGKPHAVAANSQTHPAFYFDAPWGDAVQAVAFRTVTDNKKVLHHWILYQGESSFLVGWSPGKNEKKLPADVGVHMPGTGTRLKLDVHYYNLGAGSVAETDNSGVEICVTRKKRTHTAFTYPFTASANAPANRKVTNVNTCSVEASAPVHLITSSPHMHQLGVHAKLEIVRAGGQVEVVHDKPFDFEEQQNYPIDVVLNNGDKVRTTCVYDNKSTTNVSFGTNSENEMCFNFMLYYPMCGMRCTGGDLIASAISRSQGGGCPTAQ